MAEESNAGDIGFPRGLPALVAPFGARRSSLDSL